MRKFLEAFLPNNLHFQRLVSGLLFFRLSVHNKE